MFTALVLFLLAAAPACASPVPGDRAAQPPIATFSIVACDTSRGEWGVAVASRFLAVGSVVPWARAGAGAIATQAFGNTTFGPRGLDLLAQGASAQSVLDTLLASDAGRDRRQVGLVDRNGRAATYTGSGCQPWAGGRTGDGFACQGNILVSRATVDSMAAAFTRAEGDLPDRLLAALAAGDVAGGDSRGKQSAALYVARASGGYAGFNDRYVDLRVDDHANPIGELRRLLSLHEELFLPDAHARIATAYQQAGRRDLAERETRDAVSLIRRALARKPNDPQTLNALAWFLATHDMDLREAERLARRATELAPKDANILDTLAETYFRQGKIQEAIATEEKAIALAPAGEEFRKTLERYRAARR
jgi:uncharacterized Ntn-hydrolase superfamily protein